jgi:predicted Fe-Mo cluster-binding NifX family protein
VILPESLKVGELETRIAVATQDLNGLEDVVSQVFGRSPTFTIVDVEDGVIRKIKVRKNPFADTPHGAGPLTCARLNKLGVKVVVAASFGPTVSAILKESEIKMFIVNPGTKVEDAIKECLKDYKASPPSTVEMEG